MSVEFHDYTVRVINTMNDACEQFLEEAVSEIQSQAERNTVAGKVNNGARTKNSWSHVVDGAKLEAQVGNTNENAIWEEFGTGEYALEGKGRKGGWYIPIGEGSGQISQAVVDAYGMTVVNGKDGKQFAYTKGKKPKRMLHKAFEAKKGKIIRRFERILKGRLG